VMRLDPREREGSTMVLQFTFMKSQRQCLHLQQQQEEEKKNRSEDLESEDKDLTI
jgi:hypothetical protein